MVTLTVSSDIRLTITPELQQHRGFLSDIAEALTFDNPEFKKLVRLGKWPHGVAEKIKLYWYDRDTRELRVPRGMFGILETGMRERGVDYQVDDRRAWTREVQFSSTIELRPYQAPILHPEHWRNEGVVIAPCGAGKTVMGLALAAKARRDTLWVTHTKTLARQTAEQAKKLLGFEESEIGLVGDGEERLAPFTIAMVQTLAQWDGVGRWIDMFGTVIFDECHHLPAYTWTQVAQQIPAAFRYGLTATPNRADGLGPVIFRTIGPKILEITEDQLAAEHQVVIPRLELVRTGFQAPNLWARDFAYYLDAICASEERNRLITQMVAREASDGHRCLVLSERIDHCLHLAAELNEIVPGVAAALTGRTQEHRRQAVLEACAAGSIRVIFATRLADEGLDLPELDRLFLATPSRSATRVKQQVGRIMRPAPGKTDAVVFDFVDSGSTASRQLRERMQVYRALGMLSARPAETAAQV